MMAKWIQLKNIKKIVREEVGRAVEAEKESMDRQLGKRLGKSGIKVSELGLGTWGTFNSKLDLDTAKKYIRTAFKAGVNFFDTAENYDHGNAEIILGKILKEFRREELVVSTKIFYGGKAPNQTGLSRKHLIEGTKNSLKRLKMDYVDLIFCHRPDPNTPIEETVLAMDYIVRSGLAFYWGTSEWGAREIDAAYKFAFENRCIPPTMEQPHYNMFARLKVEKEYIPLYRKYGLGIVTFSPLCSGILTGKYNKGFPKGSRLSRLKDVRKTYEEYNMLGKEAIKKVEKLRKIAKELNCTSAQLAISWILKNPHVSSVIIGISNINQLKENLKAIEVKTRLNADVEKKIEKILRNKPC